MTKTFNVVTNDIKGLCLDYIQEKSDLNFVVTIKDKKEARSSAQLRLKWLWMHHLAKEGLGGGSAEWWNRFFKGKFLRSILIQQDEDYAEFYKKADNLLSSSTDTRFCKEVMIDSIKTEWLNVASMNSFMATIQLHCSIELAISLPVPDDLKWLQEG